MTKEFNLSDYSGSDSTTKFLEIYNALDIGESIVVKSSSDFSQNILEIQSAITGPFFWAALKLGTTQWKGLFVNFNTAAHMSQSITGFMGFDHKRCDELYAAGESKILEGNIEEGIDLMEGFLIGMERHFRIEETILFPTFEQTTGMTQGPTQVMRMEHEQMKALMSQMQSAIHTNTAEQITNLGETLLILMQQHNMKEEQMLYFMMEQHLAHLAGGLIESALKIDF